MKFKQIAVVETPSCVFPHRVYAITEDGDLVYQDVHFRDISGSVTLRKLDEANWLGVEQ